MIRGHHYYKCSKSGQSLDFQTLGHEMIAAKQRLKLWLEAEGFPGLLPLLEGAEGSILDKRFQLNTILAVGRQSYIFEATDLVTHKPVIVKQAVFDYRRPLEYNRARAAKLREPLQVEGKVLMACRTGHLPQLVKIVSAPSPVPAAKATPVLREEELFLIEERIMGSTLTLVALQEWPGLSPKRREQRAQQMLSEFVTFWNSLHDTGWHYGDINADNILVEEATDRFRVVDGSSSVPAAVEVQLTTFTPAYITPNLYERIKERQKVPGSLATPLPMLAKVLHFVLTRREPLNGTVPDLNDNGLSEYSSACRDCLTALFRLDSRPQDLQVALDAVARWHQATSAR